MPGNQGQSNPEELLAAGDFSTWLLEMRSALLGQRDSNVPCGACTACCTSSQFVHIGPDETDSLKHIPEALLFAAPGLPAGHVVLGYDERGHCPMLQNGKCSIYPHRPRTCRTYDCRIFPATGVEPGSDKPLIANQARRWQFSFSDEAGRLRKAALEKAALELQHAANLSGPAPAPTQLAVGAVELLSK